MGRMPVHPHPGEHRPALGDGGLRLGEQAGHEPIVGLRGGGRVIVVALPPKRRAEERKKAENPEDPSPALPTELEVLTEMERFDYDPRLSTGVVAAGGTLGILIPPSTGFVIYAILAPRREVIEPGMQTPAE